MAPRGFRRGTRKEMAAAPVRGGELRLLCLHGYGQSARRFRARTGALRKALRGRAELLYLDAPHRLPAQPGEPEEEEEEAPRGWWLESGPGPAPEKEPEAALRAVAAALAALGPVDGLLGFSQGAALAGLVCALREGGDGRFPFRFALLVAGFPAEAAGAAGALRVPSLHVFGQADRVIPAAESRALAARFAQPVLLAHEGGHFVPAAAAQRAAYLAFLRRFAGPELGPPRPPPPAPSRASDSAPSPQEPGQSPAGAASSPSPSGEGGRGGGGEPGTGALQDTDADFPQSGL